jgi:hypothetical protein
MHVVEKPKERVTVRTSIVVSIEEEGGLGVTESVDDV